MYGYNPLGPLDLLPIHLEKMNTEASKRVKEIQDQIEKENERYQNQATRIGSQLYSNLEI